MSHPSERSQDSRRVALDDTDSLRAGQGGGLSNAEAAFRLQRDGPNVLPGADRRSVWIVVWTVLKEPMLALLLLAASVYLLLGDPQEASILGASVLLVIGLTVSQEYRSERALQALRDLSSPRARVLRDGTPRLLASREVVLGDIILVAEGDRVPADARLLDRSDLMVDESMLTGESVPVRRHCGESGTASEESVIRASTLIVQGHGTAQVVAVGSRTTVGSIGTALRTLRSPPTPMQREIRAAVNLFAVLGVASSIAMTLLYVATQGDLMQAILAGITLAMANIPEEFPVVLVVFLALGAWRMARRRVLVRRPPAIEALGSVTVLCTDKTGTLTENKMSLAELVAIDERGAPTRDLSPQLRALLVCGDAASPDASFDPMELAIRQALGRAELAPSSHGSRVHEYPLSSDLLAVTHVWRAPGAQSLDVCCKGAPEAVATLCELDEARRRSVLQEVESMASRGLRVIAAAQAQWNQDEDTLPLTPRGFSFQWLGLFGLADPLRNGVREAVAQAQAAGVRVIMLTGDHRETARAIARQAGLARTDDVALGSELATLDSEALARRAASTDVFARVKPAHKLRLVEALRKDGQVVAMTGDGVNDAPALVAAHVGVAMGERGTDVARESASIVLLDDNFVTVVEAIRQGRTIYDNIVRAVRYILAVHVPITGLALLPLLLGGPLVLFPLHVVFLQLIIDPTSTLVFEREPAAANVMLRPPRAPSSRLLNARTFWGSLAQGGVAFAIVAGVYVLGMLDELPAPQLGALTFATLVMGNLALIVLNRSDDASRRWWGQRNGAFWAIVLAAATMLATVIWFETPGRWFGFARPPALLLVGSLVAPLLALGLFQAWQSIGKPNRA